MRSVSSKHGTLAGAHLHAILDQEELVVEMSLGRRVHSVPILADQFATFGPAKSRTAQYAHSTDCVQSVGILDRMQLGTSIVPSGPLVTGPELLLCRPRHRRDDTLDQIDLFLSDRCLRRWQSEEWLKQSG